MGREFLPALVLLAVVLFSVGGCYTLGLLLAVVREPLQASQFQSGHLATEHAVSRFHVRWYAVTMIFLAFDMEMLFMYPWTLVVRSVGSSAVIEMFAFLAILIAGVGYAWREGAFRWT